MSNLIIFLINGEFMKITYKGDYALKAILDLCYFYGTGKVVPLIDISKRQNIPEKYLEQIMLLLKRAGYIDSKRGIGGGFFLLKPPENITIGEIVRIIEGPIEPIICCKEEHNSSCGEEEYCAFREVWMKVTESISSIIDNVTFANMMQRTNEFREHRTELLSEYDQKYHK